jgi:predicted RNase H-like HicB family nuclease
MEFGAFKGTPMKLRAFIVHEKNGSYSAQIPALPGVFAAGRDMKELRACLREAVRLYLEVKQEKPPRVKRGQQVRELEVRI